MESAESDKELNDDLEVVRDEHDQVLHLNYRGLTHLPDKLIQEASAFGSITRIYLKRNNIKSLPEEIGKLSNLVELYIPANELTHLPEGIGLLVKLESLDMSFNQLTSLPSSICSLQALERLNLASNKFAQLPKAIGTLMNLNVLDVMNNGMMKLPEEVTSLSNLKRLILDRNLLQWLPPRLCQMDKLEELSAASNKLLCLPLDLGAMKSLKCVYVDNNPFLHAIPVSVESQELGFSSCGIQNFEGDDDDQMQYLDIEHSDEENKKIYLPREIVRASDLEKRTVLTLLELSTRVVYRHRQNLCEGDLPTAIHKLVNSPAAQCPCCGTAIFTMGYPMVFEGQVRIYSMYKLALCCSSRCVHLASLFVNLPLIYPNASHLYCAVALVGD